MAHVSASDEVPVDDRLDHDEVTHDHPGDMLYVQVFIVLFVLTAIEVATYVVELGNALLPVILTIMVVKFGIVAAFFMHLRFDHRLFSWVFVTGVILAAIVYCILLTSLEYWPGA